MPDQYIPLSSIVNLFGGNTPLPFGDRLALLGLPAADVEDRRGGTTLMQRQHALPPFADRTDLPPFPLPAEIWLNEIQKGLGTNWTPPWDWQGPLPARLRPSGQLAKDIGYYDIGGNASR